MAKKDTRYDIAINITLHSEGDLLYKTFRSLAACALFAKTKNPQIKIMVNICLDNPDDRTKEYADRYLSILKEATDKVNSYQTDFGDPSLSRNYLIDKAIGVARFIQKADGDDLMSRQYLYRAYMVASQQTKPVVVAPEFLLDMDEWTGLLQTRIHKYWSSNDSRQVLTNLYSTNIWQSNMLISSEIFKKIHYVPNGRQYKYEDYQLNNEIIAQGFDVLIAPKTFVLYRCKSSGSIYRTQSADTGRCLAPSTLYRPDVFRKLSYLPCKEFDANQYNSWCILPDRHDVQVQTKPNYIKIYNSHIRNVFLFGKRGLTELGKSAYSAAKMAKHLLLPKPTNQAKPEPVIGQDKKQLLKLNTERLAKAGFDQMMLDEIAFLNQIEPLSVYDDAWINFVGVTPATSPKGLDDAYYRLCSIPDIDQTTDLLLIPHIVSGGADKAMIELCQTLSKAGRRVLAISTDMADNNWADKLRSIKGVIFLERQEFFHPDYINDVDLSMMFLRIIQNWPCIKTLTVMNSGVGYNLINDYAAEIKKYVKIIIHSWMYRVNERGLLDEPFILSKVYQYVDTVITDGLAYKHQLCEINGWRGNKIKAVPLPIGTVSPKQDYGIKHKIMFASRFSAQKHVEYLIDILPNLQKINVAIDFWGSLDTTDLGYAESWKKYSAAIAEASNASLSGSFNGFDQLPIDNYDLLILPTQFEGMPNIILEALKANVFVIVGDCGSIASVVQDGKNGYLVQDNSNPDAYLAAIERFYDNYDKLPSAQERQRINANLLTPHSHAHYEANIDEIYGIHQEA